MQTYGQDLNMIFPAIVSTEQMASVQIHELRAFPVLKPFLPALWLLESQDREDLNVQLYPHHTQSQVAEAHVTQK